MNAPSGMTTVIKTCHACGARLFANAKFCSACVLETGLGPIGNNDSAGGGSDNTGGGGDNTPRGSAPPGMNKANGPLRWIVEHQGHAIGRGHRQRNTPLQLARRGLAWFRRSSGCMPIASMIPARTSAKHSSIS